MAVNDPVDILRKKIETSFKVSCSSRDELPTIRNSKIIVDYNGYEGTMCYTKESEWPSKPGTRHYSSTSKKRYWN